MPDQASFDKPDLASNYSNEVLETLRANIRAAAALQPGARTNPGVGALFRSAPAAGELLLEAATNAAGTTKATVFDSRTKLSTAGGTVSGAIDSTVPSGLTAFYAANNGFFHSFNALAPTDQRFWRWSIANAGGLRFETVNDAYSSTVERVAFNTTEGLRVWAAPGGLAGQFNGPPGEGGCIRVRANAGGVGGVGVQIGQGWSVATDGIAYIINLENAPLMFGVGGANESARLYSGGELWLAGAAPVVRHRTGGQSVGEMAFSLTGAAINRGRIKLTTRRADGTAAIDGLDIGGLSDGGVYVTLGGQTAAGLASVISTNSNGAGQIAYFVPSGQRHAFFFGNVEPAGDNAQQCGANGARWSSVWAANGTIQTSDGRDKVDVESIDGAKAHAFLQLLDPITFRWLIGGTKQTQVLDGYDEIEIESEETYEDIDLQPVMRNVLVDEPAEEIEVVNGRAIVRQVVKQREVQEPVGSWVDVTDEAGQPIMVATGRTITIGRGRRAKQQPEMVPRRHFVPQLEQVTVQRVRKVTKTEQRPRWKVETESEAGRRFHAGFIAQQLREALEKAGLDREGKALGLWVQDDVNDPASRQSLRPDQLIPLIVAAYQFQASRIDALATKLEV